jgi:hypothetical protein
VWVSVSVENAALLGSPEKKSTYAIDSTQWEKKSMVKTLTRGLVDTADWDDLVHDIVHYKTVQIHELLLLLVAASCKCPINLLTIPIPFIVVHNTGRMTDLFSSDFLLILCSPTNDGYYIHKDMIKDSEWCSHLLSCIRITMCSNLIPGMAAACSWAVEWGKIHISKDIWICSNLCLHELLRPYFFYSTVSLIGLYLCG